MLSFILPAIVLIGFGSAQTQDDCPKGLIRDKYLTVHGGACYEFLPQYPLDYTDANADCISRGGTLALVKTKEVSDYLIDQLVQFGVADPIWIGLNDKAKEGTYVWEDGTPLSESYSNWAPTRKGTSESHDCVYLQTSKNGYWDEDFCEDTFLGLFRHQRSFVCQYSAGATTKPPA